MQAQSASERMAGDLEKIDYRTEPSILLFCDDPGQRARISASVTAAGGRISAALGLAEAVDRIADHAAPDGIVVDAVFAAEPLAEQIFDTLEQGARSHRFRSIALIDDRLIDLAATRAGHSDVQLLCAPDAGSLSAAIDTLLARRKTELKDIGAESAPVKLRALSEEVGRIAQLLAALSNPPPLADEKPARVEIDAPAIRAMIRARRMRDQFFQPELFADPAWDMLLDLTAARLEGRPVAVSSLCIAAAVPPTTALRWIKTLTDLGMFVRVADNSDRRRVFIELSPTIADAMIACLATIQQVSGAPA
jgi:CheY-like chemotaxis protein